jgi:hypothetical protein
LRNIRNNCIKIKVLNLVVFPSTAVLAFFATTESRSSPPELKIF